MSVLVLLCVYSEVFKRKMVIYANIYREFHTIVIILSIPNFSILHKSLSYGVFVLSLSAVVYCCQVLI